MNPQLGKIGDVGNLCRQLGKLVINNTQSIETYNVTNLCRKLTYLIIIDIKLGETCQIADL